MPLQLLLSDSSYDLISSLDLGKCLFSWNSHASDVLLWSTSFQIDGGSLCDGRIRAYGVKPDYRETASRHEHLTDHVEGVHDVEPWQPQAILSAQAYWGDMDIPTLSIQFAYCAAVLTLGAAFIYCLLTLRARKT